MNFNYGKLDEFLDKLSEAEPYQTGPTNKARGKFSSFDSLTNQVLNLFTSVSEELENNILCCTTETQERNLKNYYHRKLNAGFDRYCFCYERFLKKVEETEIYTNGVTENLPPFKNNLLSLQMVTELEKTIGQIKKHIHGLQENQEKANILQFKKIVWNGTQKNLAELFLELESKGWISEIGTGERAQVCKTIEGMFDLSGTKKKGKKETNSLKSFIEIMTPFQDNRTKEKSYPKVYSSQYKKQFDKIAKAKKTT